MPWCSLCISISVLNTLSYRNNVLEDDQLECPVKLNVVIEEHVLREEKIPAALEKNGHWRNGHWRLLC